MKKQLIILLTCLLAFGASAQTVGNFTRVTVRDSIFLISTANWFKGISSDNTFGAGANNILPTQAAVKSALAQYILLSQKGAGSGVATLDGTSKVPVSQLGNLSGTAPITYNSGTGAFGINQATTSTNGYLSSADWNIFTNKLGSLNGETSSIQTLSTGTTGNNINWSSSGGVHTLNVPDASAANRGVVTTGTQTFAGGKTFSSALTLSSIPALGTAGTMFLTPNAGVISSRTAAQVLADIGGISGNQNITLSGDVTGSGTTSITTTLANTGTAGTYTKVTTDSKGRVTSGTNLSASDIPTLAAYIQNTTSAQSSSNFHISGTGQSNTQFEVLKDGSVSAAPHYAFKDASGSLKAYFQLTEDATPGIGVRVAGTERMRITANGNGYVGIRDAGPTSTLSVLGSFAVQYGAIVASGSLDHNTCLNRITTGGITITLPAASSCANRVYEIRNEANSSCTISAVLIDGVSTTTIPANTYWKIASEGAAWRLLSRSN